MMKKSLEHRYYVAELTMRGWRRISRDFASVKDAQALRNTLKPQYPRACIVAEVK